MAANVGGPLSEREIEELDSALAAVPEPQESLDVVMLDGFLVGVLLQPDPVPVDQWMPYVFSSEGLPADPPVEPAAHARITELVLRHHNYLAACLNAREGFDPIVYPVEDDVGKPVSGRASIEALAPWAAGFMSALNAFPQLLDTYGESAELAESLVGVMRHLPTDPDEPPAEAKRFAEDKLRLERDMPLADLDDAIEHLVECVLDAADIARPRKPRARETPKVGRNEPCPCGSGKKYKQCHGATAK